MEVAAAAPAAAPAAIVGEAGSSFSSSSSSEDTRPTATATFSKKFMTPPSFSFSGEPPVPEAASPPSTVDDGAPSPEPNSIDVITSPPPLPEGLPDPSTSMSAAGGAEVETSTDGTAAPPPGVKAGADAERSELSPLAAAAASLGAGLYAEYDI